MYQIEIAMSAELFARVLRAVSEQGYSDAAIAALEDLAEAVEDYTLDDLLQYQEVGEDYIDREIDHEQLEDFAEMHGGWASQADLDWGVGRYADPDDLSQWASWMRATKHAKDVIECTDGHKVVSLLLRFE